LQSIGRVAPVLMDTSPKRKRGGSLVLPRLRFGLMSVRELLTFR
jgi:hypothetical protein